MLQACVCYEECDAFDYDCSLNCGIQGHHCHEKCPCGPLCPDGCPCDGFCDENANHTTLIISEYGTDRNQKPWLFKWIIDEYSEQIPEYR